MHVKILDQIQGTDTPYLSFSVINTSGKMFYTERLTWNMSHELFLSIFLSISLSMFKQLFLLNETEAH